MTSNPAIDFHSLGVDISLSLREDFYGTKMSSFPTGAPADDKPTYPTSSLLDYGVAAPHLFGHSVGQVMVRVLEALGAYPPPGIGDLFELIQDINSHMPVAEPFYVLRSVLKTDADSRPGEDKPKPYRDHVLHPASMYLLGRRFLTMPVDGQPYERAFVKRVFSSAAGREALLFADRTAPPERDGQRRVLRLAWTIAALSHDLGYAFDAGAYLHERQFDTRWFKPVRPQVADHHQRLAESLCSADTKKRMGHAAELIEKTFIEPAISHLKSAPRLDHGQLMALLLLRTLYGDSRNRDMIASPERAMAMYLAVRAIFFHDLWTKPKNLHRPEAADDPFSVFVCLLDLVAELRLIWNRVKLVPSDYQSCWVIDVWLPIQSIAFDATSNPPRLTFGKNTSAPDRLFTDSQYDINLATGSTTGAGDNPSKSIREKQDQYVRLLKKLRILTGDNLDVAIT